MELISKESILTWAEEYANCTVGAERFAAIQFVNRIKNEKSFWIGIDLNRKECEVEDA